MIMKLMIITYHYTNENDEVNLFFCAIIVFMYEFAKNRKDLMKLSRLAKYI